MQVRQEVVFSLSSGGWVSNALESTLERGKISRNGFKYPVGWGAKVVIYNNRIS